MNTKAKPFAKMLSAGTTLGGIIGLITDLLSPMKTPYGFYCAIFLIFLFMVSLLLYFIPKTNIYFEKRLEPYWYPPTALMLVLASTLLFGLHYLTNKYSKDNSGILGTYITEIKVIQKNIGIIESNTKNILINTEDIAERTKNIEEISSSIDIKLDNVKKETSNDPRKELSNLGVEWSVKSFVEAIKEGDMPKIKLFIDGGMKATTSYKGTSAILFGMQDNLDNNQVDILELFVLNGFDLNTNLVDPLIMSNLTNNAMPMPYDADNKPKGYGGRKFVGSLIFWEVMLNLWKAPKDNNLNVIQYLLDKEVDLEITMSMLDHEKYIREKHGFGMPASGHLPIYELLHYIP